MSSGEIRRMIATEVNPKMNVSLRFVRSVAPRRRSYPSARTAPGTTTATLSSKPSPHRGPSRRRGATREVNSSADMA